MDPSGPKGRGDELVVGRLIEELVRAAVQCHCPDRQKVFLLHGANRTGVQIVRPGAEPAQFYVGWPIRFVIYDASTKVLVVEAHISPKVLEQWKNRAPPPAATGAKLRQSWWGEG